MSLQQLDGGAELDISITPVNGFNGTVTITFPELTRWRYRGCGWLLFGSAFRRFSGDGIECWHLGIASGRDRE